MQVYGHGRLNGAFRREPKYPRYSSSQLFQGVFVCGCLFWARPPSISLSLPFVGGGFPYRKKTSGTLIPSSLEDLVWVHGSGKPPPVWFGPVAGPSGQVRPSGLSFGAAMGACERSSHWRHALDLLSTAKTFSLLETSLVKAVVRRASEKTERRRKKRRACLLGPSLEFWTLILSLFGKTISLTTTKIGLALGHPLRIRA